jgi:hypothetical protein
MAKNKDTAETQTAPESTQEGNVVTTTYPDGTVLRNAVATDAA